MDKRKVIYYEDELNDEFSTAQINPRKIDKNYVYVKKGLIKKITHIFWYRVVATPIAFFVLKFKFHHKIIGKEKVKMLGKKKPYFIYGNHTHFLCDALIPTFVSMPNDVYVIVHPNNVSIPYLGRVTPSLGALPLPDDIEATKNFIKAIETRINQNHPIMIYPEAHIWPYYTKIRPFLSTSFRYPIKYNVPSFAVTNTYQKRKRSNKFKIVTYIDGPFYKNENLSLALQREDLRNRVYEAMVERSKLNNVELIKYLKKEESDD